MIGEVAVVTDSAAMLPAALTERYGISAVPLTVVLDGREYLDGVELTADELYERLPGVRTVSTSQPSPGQLLAAYQAAADAGARRILSLHIGANVSGTVASARAAAASSPVPVTVVDTAQASFAEGLCVWEACEALASGASADEAAQRARAAGAQVGNTFIVRALGLARRGGRLRDGGEVAPDGIPVLALHQDGMRVAGSARTAGEAVSLMAEHVEAASAARPGRRLRVGVGHGAAPEIAVTLSARIRDMPRVDELVEYVVGPSIGAHLGAGNAGAVFLARPVA